MNTLVKICGITNVEDALAASEAGADYLGFIFHAPSKRSVSQESAKQIVAQLAESQHRPIFVGVFVNETAPAMAQVMDYCQLDLAQLSGDETPAMVGDPTSAVYGRCYKALRPSSLAEAEADAEWYTPPEPVDGQPTLLIDTYHPFLHGGTGQTANWKIAAKMAGNMAGLMLAGGLNPANVGQAIREVRPFGVDVASGVEVRPGKKDHELIRDFLGAARSA